VVLLYLKRLKVPNASLGGVIILKKCISFDSIFSIDFDLNLSICSCLVLSYALVSFPGMTKCLLLSDTSLVSELRFSET